MYPTTMPSSFMLPPINAGSTTQLSVSPQKKRKELGLVSDKMIESLEKQQEILQQIAINMQGDRMGKVDKTRRAMMEKIKRLEYENMLRDQELLVGKLFFGSQCKLLQGNQFSRISIHSS